jgi:hypothetical protein
LGKEILNSHFPEFLGDTVDAHFNAQFECVGLLTDLRAKLSCSLVYWRSSHQHKVSAREVALRESNILSTSILSSSACF